MIDKTELHRNTLLFLHLRIYSECQISGFPISSIDKKSQHPIFCRQFCDNTRLLAHPNADKASKADKTGEHHDRQESHALGG
ncbi:MAG: hypothetical protein HUJ14_03970 [Marinobacter sp.]|nr:hypothetical protein [Marinobacter sp.]